MVPSARPVRGRPPMVSTAPPASSAHSLGAPGVVRHRQGRSPYLASEEPDQGGLLPCPLPQGRVWKPLPPGPEQQELQSALGGEGSRPRADSNSPSFLLMGLKEGPLGLLTAPGPGPLTCAPLDVYSLRRCVRAPPPGRGEAHIRLLCPPPSSSTPSSRTHRSPLIAPGGWPGGAGPWRRGPGWREGRRIPAL